MLIQRPSDHLDVTRPCSSFLSQGRVDDEAAAWFARHDAGLPAADVPAFERWLAADPRHVAAWREFEHCLRPLADARGTVLADDMARELARRRQRREQRRWRMLAGASVTLAAAAAVAVLLFPRLSLTPPVSLPAANGAVVITQPEKRELPDGSVVELNVGAAIDVRFTPERRDVRLVQGEAHFEVAKNAARPFVVATHGVEVRAVGTAFSVAASASAVNVVVTHGRVAVARSPDGSSPGSAPMEPIFADAGMRVSIADAADPQLTTIVPAEIERELAWRGPRLELSGTTLADAVSAFNRENRVQLRLADRSLEELRLSGTFRVDNAEGFARVLEGYYGVAVERTESVITLRSAR